MEKTSEQIAMHVSAVSITANLLLSAFKFLAGFLGHSAAMISDAVHSASDVVSTVIVIIGVKISGKEADKEHQYGHERFECVASIILAVILCVTGIGIGITGFRNILSGEYGSFAVPGMLALAAAVVSIVVKECMFWYTKIAADRINSGALMADAWHHRSDALSSIGSFVGILGAKLGLPIFDSLASIAICVFIVKAAIGIFRDAVGKMTDESCDADTENRMKQVVLEQKGVEGLDLIHTRKFGSRIYVDIEIRADGQIPLWQAHEIAENVHLSIEQNFKAVKHCMVHVNPDGQHQR